MDNNQNDVEKTSSEQQVEETTMASSNQPEETIKVSSEHAEAAAEDTNSHPDAADSPSSEKTDTTAKVSSEQTDATSQASSEQTNTDAKASSEKTDTTAKASSEQTDATANASSEKTGTSAKASSEKKQGAAKTSTGGQKTARTAASQSKTTTGSTAKRTTTRKTTSAPRNTAQKSTAAKQTAKSTAAKEETSDESDSEKKKGKKDTKMTISGHLKELRNRVAICFIFLVIAFLIALYFSQDVINFLTDMGTSYDYTFVYIAPQELLMQQFSISLVVAICVTLPLILYHVWAYVQPALKKREKSMFLAAIISGLICFVIGVLFAYYIMLPFMLRFLIGLSSGTNISASISVKEYLNFETTIFIVMGFIFEMPVLFVILTQLGLLKVEWLRKGFKYAVIVIFIIAALVTPPDIVSQSMVALPMIGLYWISILISSALLKFKPKKAEDEDEDGDDDDDD